ncbi:MAG: hypothetical protein R2939_10050 [Kofleriaceae bacterium]
MLPAAAVPPSSAPTAGPSAPTQLHDTEAANAAAAAIAAETPRPGSLSSPPPGASPPPSAFAGPGLHDLETPIGLRRAQLGAQLVSPAPAGVHGGVDLAQLAAQPIRKLPPWALAACFVIALGLAMALTIVVARVVT